MNFFSLPRLIGSVLCLLWCYIEPSISFICVCFFALMLDCYTAWRCNRRIYKKYREAIKRNPKCKTDGKFKSKKMMKAVQDFSVVIMTIVLATFTDNVILSHIEPLHLANYLSAAYCGAQFISILENESTCNGAPWARFMQKIVADKTERHFNIKLKELMAYEDKIKEAEETKSDETETDDVNL